MRPSKTTSLVGNTNKAKKVFGYKLKTKLDDLIKIAGDKDVKAAKTIFVYKNNTNSENKAYLLKENQISNFKITLKRYALESPLKEKILTKTLSVNKFLTTQKKKNY